MSRVAVLEGDAAGGVCDAWGLCASICGAIGFCCVCVFKGGRPPLNCAYTEVAVDKKSTAASFFIFE